MAQKIISAETCELLSTLLHFIPADELQLRIDAQVLCHNVCTALALPDAEPVVYQYRTRPVGYEPGDGWSRWMLCSKHCFDDYAKLPGYNNWQYETRQLFATPQPAIAHALQEPVRLTDEEILSDGPGQEDAPWPYSAQLHSARAIEATIHAKQKSQSSLSARSSPRSEA